MKINCRKLTLRERSEYLFYNHSKMELPLRERAREIEYRSFEYIAQDKRDNVHGIRSSIYGPHKSSYWDMRVMKEPQMWTIFNSLSNLAYEITSFKSRVTNAYHNIYPIKEGETKMGKFTDETRNQLFKPVHGIKKQLINFEETLISTVTRQIKGKYGIEMSAWQPAEIDILTDWIKDHDPNFRNHITNPYALNDSRSNKYVLCGVFFIKVAEDTYIFVDAEKWRFNSRENTESAPIYLYIFGKKSPAIFKKLSSFISTKNTTSNKIYSIVGVKDGDKSYWNCTASKLTPRTIDTIFMDKEQKKRITDHIDQWVRNEEMYTNRGLLFKTGILLHGKAGTGKSSMAMAIANYLGCGLITIDPTTFQFMNIPEITESIVADETTYVILIDEIDTLFVSRDIQDASEIQKEKTAKLLAFLDSPQSPTNVIFVATTNYIERLDKALLRKGRFDIVEEMGDISRPVAMEMCKSFDLTEDEGNELLNGHESVNPAQLQDEILTLIKKKEQEKASEELDRIASKLPVEETAPDKIETPETPVDNPVEDDANDQEPCDLAEDNSNTKDKVTVIEAKKYKSAKEYEDTK